MIESIANYVPELASKAIWLVLFGLFLQVAGKPLLSHCSLLAQMERRSARQATRYILLTVAAVGVIFIFAL